MAKSRCDRFQEWWGTPACYIYINYVLSSWGDWMWQFAAGLYLVHLAQGSLRLAAIFGFIGGSLILFLGGLIGAWVDRTQRLKVVRITLFIQNLAVMLCAIVVYLVLVYQPQIEPMWDGSMKPLSEALIIALAVVAYLASMAYKVSIEKDWIVVVASGNTSKLTNLNAVTRAIDLSCNVLAPTVAGLVMTYGSMINAAIMIAAWNFSSVFLEYFLLWKVYSMVPRLAVKEDAPPQVLHVDLSDLEMDVVAEEEKEQLNSDDKKSATPEDGEGNGEPEEKEQLNSDDKRSATPEDGEGKGEPDHSQEEEHEQQGKEEKVRHTKDNAKKEKSKEAVATEESDVTQPLAKPEEGTGSGEDGNAERRGKTCCQLMASPFVQFFQGFVTYSQQRVVFAGLALAALYMTVLGFDSVTTGYIYASGVNESIVGISMALAGLTGIFGTIVFTRLKKRVGLQRTGLIAFNSEIICLVLCLVSIWAPGSPFNPTFSKITCSAINATEIPVGNLEDVNLTNFRVRRSIAYPSPVQHTELLSFLPGGGAAEKVQWLLPTTKQSTHGIVKRQAVGGGPEVTTVQALPSTDTMDPCQEPDSSKISVSLFLTGIITSRVGLWMADLVVTQLLQECVQEKERGVVNGVQNSLNRLMDMVKFTLVIFLPKIETFGILVILSFAFICMAGCLFAYYSWTVRGHLFHFEKITQCICNNNKGERQANGHVQGKCDLHPRPEGDVDAREETPDNNHVV